MRCYYARVVDRVFFDAEESKVTVSTPRGKSAQVPASWVMSSHGKQPGRKSSRIRLR